MNKKKKKLKQTKKKHKKMLAHVYCRALTNDWNILNEAFVPLYKYALRSVCRVKADVFFSKQKKEKFLYMMQKYCC